MKIIIVPHTHWDREWYFTSETSQVLWNFNLDNCINYNYPITKFYLDGQVSLVEDYLKHANDANKKKFIELIKQQKLIVGPWYSQPDVFNSLGETTMRNLELAKTLLTEWGFSGTSTLYCPDTFGFSDSLPQIARLAGFKDFVFWRGVKKQAYEFDTFIWKGIDGSMLNCYRLKFGYWTLGSMFPWKQLNENNIKEQAQIFHDNFIKSDVCKHFRTQASKQNDIVMFPFGGDQAPIHPLTNEFFAAVNELSSDQWVIGSFEDYFSQQKPFEEITGILDYGYDSKIHRTITTTRYDFKKLFRENEIALYHQLEPLELYYQFCDPHYIINNDDIIKQLCLMQAHDVLGGCVTDNVYTSSYQKLLDIKERIDTKIALLLKQLGLQLDLKPKHILVFNPNVGGKAHNCICQTVYTDQKLAGSIKNDTYSVYVINSKSYPAVEHTYQSELLIINKNLKPLNLQVIDLNQLKTTDCPILSDYNKPTLYNQFLINPDCGDLFDADEIVDHTFKLENTVLSSKLSSFSEIDIIEIIGELKFNQIVSPYKIHVISLYNGDNEISIQIDNHFKNVVVKWIPPQTYHAPQFLQHLGVQKYVPRTVENWKQAGYKDHPLAVEKNSGIIFDQKTYICTRGTNEFYYAKNQVIITLYRSTDALGKPDLNSRPGVASGLTNHLISTPLGQLLKPLIFDFQFGSHQANAEHKLNSFYKKPIAFQIASNNLIASKMERFVFLKQPFDIKQMKLELPSGFISSLRALDNSRALVTILNLNGNPIKYLDHEITFNQIKQVEIKYAK